MDTGWLKTAEGVSVYALMDINLNSVTCKSGDCSTFRLFRRFCICGTCPISSLDVDACHLFSAGVGFLVLLLILCACVKSKFSAEKQFSSVGPSSRAESICRRNKNFFVFLCHLLDCSRSWRRQTLLSLLSKGTLIRQVPFKQQFSLLVNINLLQSASPVFQWGKKNRL